VDRVHDLWTGRLGLGPRWTNGGTNKRCGGAAPTQGAQALWLTGARWWQPRWTRQSRLWPHRSTGGGVEVEMNDDGLSSSHGR
jgi:hypothetical protein